MTDFCHISPTPLLPMFGGGRSSHLVLAHLVESDEEYRDFYANIDGVKILDNSAFEMYKQGRDMYDSAKLVQMGHAIKADYIVMTDYPNEPGERTVNAAKMLAPEFKSEGFGTFFCPQSKIGDKKDLINGFRWAIGEGMDYVDYIGISILAVPNAYGVEKNNKLQRFLSRWKFMRELERDCSFFEEVECSSLKLHMLGMVDGPNEIDLLEHFMPYISTWDSSAAVWAGLNGIEFDGSPSGLMDGKFEEEVDFAYDRLDAKNLAKAMKNVRYIDKKLKEYVY